MTWLLALLAMAAMVAVVRLRPRQHDDGIAAYVLVLLMAWLVAGSVGASGWVKHTDLLEPLALVATAATVVVARLSLRGTTYWLGIEVAGVAAVYGFTASDPWWLATSFPAWVLGVRHDLDLAVLVCLCGAVWLATSWTVFWVAMRRSLLWALLPGGLVLAIEVLNDPGESGLGTRVVVWMALAAALGMTLNLSRLQQRWGSRAEDVTLRTAVSGGRALIAGLAVAVLLPPLATQDISGRFFHAETHAPEAGRSGGSGTSGTGPGQAGLVQIGYTEHVVPGGALHRGTDLVMQVVDDWGGTHYWRGIALYHLANGAWDLGTVPRRSIRFAPGQTVEAQTDAARKTVQARIRVTGAPQTTIFWPGEPQAIDRQTLVLGEPGQGGALLQADASYAAGSSIPTGATYNVTGTLPVATETDLRAANGTDPTWVTDLTLDPAQAAAIDPRVRGLAARLTAAATTRYDQAKAIEAYLRTLTYRLDVSTPPPGTDPVTHFLFQTRTGYCEYFASSMGEMLRSLGIPVRLVNGYGPGTLSATQEQVGVQERQSSYIIHASDAHTWVEFYFPGYGWIPFEPTPDPLYPPIPRGPVSGPANQPAPVQVPIPGQVAGRAPGAAGNLIPWGWVAAPVGLAGVALVWLLALLLLGSPRPTDLDAAWRRVGWVGRRLKVKRKDSDTPLEFGQRLARVVPDLGEEIEALAGAYSQRCYAPGAAPAVDVAAAWKRVRGRMLPLLVRGLP